MPEEQGPNYSDKSARAFEPQLKGRMGTVSDGAITHLRYVGVCVPDYAAERRFVSSIWGLTEAASDKDAAYFAAEGSSNAYVYRLRSAPERALEVISFALRSEAAVDASAERLAAFGVQLIDQPHRLNEPGGGYGFRFFDLDGRTVELSCGVKERAARALARGESVPATLSHVVLHTPDVRKSAVFYEQHLGLRVSDWLGEFMCFLRCNSVHHCLAFIPGPACLNHVAFEMRDLDELMRGVARLSKENVVLGWGPGRHTAGNNVFSYFLAPSGHVLEYTAEMQRIDEGTWQPTVYKPSPAITDQWGTGSLNGRGVHRLGAPVPDPGLWKAAPR
jgi:catechol 2,3-dioxygenase-like lactoylglutathione lyase family enzyme